MLDDRIKYLQLTQSDYLPFINDRHYVTLKGDKYQNYPKNRKYLLKSKMFTEVCFCLIKKSR